MRIRDADPCFAARYNNWSRIDSLCMQVFADLRSIDANSTAVDFGDQGYNGLTDRREIPEGYRNKLIPMLDWTMDLVSRSGGGIIPVYGKMHEYIEFPDSAFASFVYYLRPIIQDMETITSSGICNLNSQIEKLREVLAMAEEETQRKCGDKVDQGDADD